MIKHPESGLDMYTLSEVAALLGMSDSEFDSHFEQNRGEFSDGEDYELVSEEGKDPQLFFFADALPKLIDAT